MAIYRGAGGAGDATNDATSQAILAAQSAADAAASQAAAAGSASSAATSATNAASSATSAANSASTATTQADNAATSASNAASSASTATTKASEAATSATNAASSASAASTSATNAASSASSASSSATSASNSASAASTSATNAANSATAAATSATNAATSETNAASSASSASTSATNASNSASAAATSETNAASSASTATTQASNAASSATAAATSASNAATSATNAANSASAATTSATNASNSATAASTSAMAAAGSATSAAGSATAAASSASDAADSAADAAGYAASINPADLVHISGTETITGSKTFSINPTLSGGTANGVAYLNGSKVLTTGSALTFDGSNLALGTSAIDRLTVLGAGRFTNGTNSIGLGADSTSAYLEAASGVAAIRFNANGSEQMRLTSTGLGIGTSSPAAKLQVSGGNVRLSDGQQIEWGGSTNSIEGSNASNYLRFWTNNTARMTLDTSGNLGLGVTPSAWGSGYKAIQLATTGSVYGTVGSTYNGLMSNAYLNSSGNPIYIASDYATQYTTGAGRHIWNTAPSGTAGNAISFTQAMTLDASGNLGIGSNKYFGFDTNAKYIPEDGSVGGALYTAGGFRFFTGGANERMRIDSSGRLGIGTTSIAGRVSSVADVYSSFTAMASTAGTNLSVNVLKVTDLGATSFATGVYAALSHVWQISSTERMRIDSSGNLLVGRTTGWDFGTSNTSGVGAQQNGVFFASRDGGSSGYFKRYSSTGNIVEFNYGTGIVGTISTNGTGVTYGTSSDYRLKENVQPMQNALDTIKKLNPVTYTWKADGSDGQGFIAHELQAVVPDCVTGEKDAVDDEGKPVYQGIDTSFLVGILTKAIQELNEKIDAQAAEIAQLKGA